MLVRVGKLLANLQESSEAVVFAERGLPAGTGGAGSEHHLNRIRLNALLKSLLKIV